MPAGGRAKIDYVEAERLFVVEELSLRAIATKLGLKSNSSLSAVAKRDDWLGKRAAYKAAIARRSYEVSAATVANQNQEIRDEAVLAGRVTIRKYLEQLSKDDVRITPRDAQVWAAFLLSEATNPGGSSPETPELKNVTPADTEQLRRIVEAARRQVAPSGGLGGVALVEPPTTRPN